MLPVNVCLCGRRVPCCGLVRCQEVQRDNHPNRFRCNGTFQVFHVFVPVLKDNDFRMKVWRQSALPLRERK